MAMAWRYARNFLGLSTVSNETRDGSFVVPPSNPKHDVFLSFRGDDTRDNFTSHLKAALLRKQIQVYIDETQDTGVEISPALVQAIEGSRVAVVIFSKNYADSSWCLNELVHILECKKRDRMFVVPVFYHVKPSDVRKQTGPFANALSKFKKSDKAVLLKWKAALTEAANLCGWDSANYRLEAKFVELVVGDVIRKLRGQPTVDFTGLVGFPQRLEGVESMLQIDSLDVRIIGIWGMGGIGKTTLAKAMYHQIYFEFDACCFLMDVRDKWKDGQGRYYLQNKLMSELFPGENVQADDVYRIVDRRLKFKKVLIVLDDVDKSMQLNAIAGDRDWYGPGSRIILTSRDDRALDGSDEKFKVAELSREEAIELFQLEAFKTRPLTEEQFERSKAAVDDCFKTDFNPLALFHLASTLKTEGFETWTGIIKELNEKPDETVYRVLKRSYDGLGDDKKKDIFLDIACFFNGESSDFAERILDGCGFSANVGIKDLKHKSLLNIVDFNKLWMQHLIEATGREIVRIESAEPGERTRLWNRVDLRHVFNNKSETNKIQGISVDMFCKDPVKVSPQVFTKMKNIRVLRFHNHLGKCMLMFTDQEQLNSLPENLRYLCWDGYPFIYLPSNFTGRNLVELKMQYSNLEKLWDGVQPQDLKNLRVLDLSFSRQLIEIPNLSKATKVESVCLRGCVLVSEVPQYFKVLGQLKSLNLKDCSSLKTVSALPSNIEDVNLARCVSLKTLPENIPTLSSLNRLQLDGCSKFECSPEIEAFLKDVRG